MDWRQAGSRSPPSSAIRLVCPRATTIYLSEANSFSESAFLLINVETIYAHSWHWPCQSSEWTNKWKVFLFKEARMIRTYYICLLCFRDSHPGIVRPNIWIRWWSLFVYVTLIACACWIIDDIWVPYLRLQQAQWRHPTHTTSQMKRK